MQSCRFPFAIVLIILIITSFLLDRGREGTILGLAETRADTCEPFVIRDALKDNAETSESKRRYAGSRLTEQEVQQLLAAHNAVRAKVGTAPLVWSDKLALYAQEWADHLAATRRRMEHRPHSGKWKQEHGENLFMGTAGYYGVSNAVAAWEREQSAYRREPVDASNFYSYGHYTQIIWGNTKSIGCAKVECDGNVIIVCNYDPPGNILGRKPY